MVQPLLVSISALTLATETVRSILKIDDVVRVRVQRGDEPSFCWAPPTDLCICWFWQVNAR